MGAKADAERYCLVLDARYVHSAPWPPILWPKMDTRVRSCTADSARMGKEGRCSHDGQSGSFQNLRNLELNVCAHVVVASVLWVRGVQVEASPCRESTSSRTSTFAMQECAVPVPKSQSSSSPSIPAPRGEVSVKRIAMPSLAAGPRKFPF